MTHTNPKRERGRVLNEAHSDSSEVLGGLLFPDERTAVVGFDPEGITAISRGLSVRDTPGRDHREVVCILKGCWQALVARQIEPCWHPFRMQTTLTKLVRGCRFAQPPG